MSMKLGNSLFVFLSAVDLLSGSVCRSYALTRPLCLPFRCSIRVLDPISSSTARLGLMWPSSLRMTQSWGVWMRNWLEWTTWKWEVRPNSQIAGKLVSENVDLESKNCMSSEHLSACVNCTFQTSFGPRWFGRVETGGRRISDSLTRGSFYGLHLYLMTKYWTSETTEKARESGGGGDVGRPLSVVCMR